jgi:hypothetical protein
VSIIEALNILEGKTSKRDNLANVVVDVNHDVDNLTADVLKTRADDVDVTAGKYCHSYSVNTL